MPNSRVKSRIVKSFITDPEQKDWRQTCALVLLRVAEGLRRRVCGAGVEQVGISPLITRCSSAAWSDVFRARKPHRPLQGSTRLRVIRSSRHGGHFRQLFEVRWQLVLLVVVKPCLPTAAAPMGRRRTKPRLTQSQPPPGKGFRGFDRERQSLGLHRLRAAAHQEISLRIIHLRDLRFGHSDRPTESMIIDPPSPVKAG